MCSPGDPGRPAAWGCNAATAGAQVPNPDVNAVLQELLRAIDQYFAED